MKKYIALFVQLVFCVSVGMERVSLDVVTVSSVGRHQEVLTPRISVACHPTSAKESLELARLINDGSYNEVLVKLDTFSCLNAYGPMIVLQDIRQGEIVEESPFSCRELWADYSLPGIKKENFLQCCLYIAKSMENMYFNSDEKVAMHYFMMARHMQNLPPLAQINPVKALVLNIKNHNYHEVLEMACKQKNIFSHELMVILREVIYQSISAESPLFSSDNWYTYVPADDVNKDSFLSVVLYVAKKRQDCYRKRGSSKVDYYRELRSRVLSFR